MKVNKFSIFQTFFSYFYHVTICLSCLSCHYILSHFCELQNHLQIEESLKVENTKEVIINQTGTSCDAVIVEDGEIRRIAEIGQFFQDAPSVT